MNTDGPNIFVLEKVQIVFESEKLDYIFKVPPSSLSLRKTVILVTLGSIKTAKWGCRLRTQEKGRAENRLRC